MIKKLNESKIGSEEYFALLEEYDREINQLREELESLLGREIKFRNEYDSPIQLEKFEKQNGWEMILKNFLERNNKRVIYLMNGFYSGKIDYEKAEEVLEKIARDVSGLPVVNIQKLRNSR